MRYVDYKEEYAGAVAELWNESAINWPEGLDASPVKTADEVVKELSTGDYLKVILALSDNRKIVGYCDLKPSPNMKDVCYVETLNVHPKYQGYGIGRQLLKRIIDFSIIERMGRIDAFTWPSNEKAIHLYKKMGFFWKPNTSVQMINFLPKLFNNGFLKWKFIKNWSTLLCVDPKTGFDEIEGDGRAYYPYIFGIKQNPIEIRIDNLSEAVYYYKTKRIVFIISANSIIPQRDSHKIVIRNKGFQPIKAKLYHKEKESPMNIIQNTIEIKPENLKSGGEYSLRILARYGGIDFTFEAGFYIQSKIEHIEQSYFISNQFQKIVFRKFADLNLPLECEITVDRFRGVTYSYMIHEKNELFAVDMNDILKLLPPGIYKTKFVFKEKLKMFKTTTIELLIIIDGKKTILHAEVENGVLIWLRDCYYFVRNPGAKLIIHSHNLIDRGFIYAGFDEIVGKKGGVGKQEFKFQYVSKDSEVLIRAISTELIKEFTFRNPGDVMIRYRLPETSTILSTAYLMDESAELKIGASKKPITMFHVDGRELIKKYKKFKLITRNYHVGCSIYKNSIKEIDIAPDKINFLVKPKKKTVSVKWQVRKRKKVFSPYSIRAQTMLENIKFIQLSKKHYQCSEKNISIATDPSFGPIIHSIKFNNNEMLLTDYPKVGQFGEIWPWYGGLYTLGCMANRKIIGNYKELHFKQKGETFNISTHFDNIQIPGILIKTHMPWISNTRNVYLETYFFLLSHELLIISRFENEIQVPLPCYFASLGYIKPYSDMLINSDILHEKISLSDDHLEIPGNGEFQLVSRKNSFAIKYILSCNLDSNLKLVNLAHNKGFNLILDIKDYFKPSDIVVQQLQFEKI